jgi:predicted lipid-binding transport protein (Tim44 family)
MRKTFAFLAVVMALGIASVSLDAQAKRLGGGKSSGMQRQTTTAPANSPAGAANTPGSPGQAAPVAGSAAAAAAGPAAGAASKRSWMGPVAGLAAGLGLAALASHLGFGEALANMMMLGLLVMAVLLVIGFVMRKRMAAQGALLATSGGGSGAAPEPEPLLSRNASYRSTTSQADGGSQIGSRLGAGLGSLVAANRRDAIPADFDTAAFARNAKTQFLALQAANDARDLDRLQGYLTPEMFDNVRGDIMERGNAPQHTQVFGLEAQVLAVAEEDSRYVVSVRFTGSVRDQAGAQPDDLDEIWHLTKSRIDDGGWVIAGIGQRSDSLLNN